MPGIKYETFDAPESAVRIVKDTEMTFGDMNMWKLTVKRRDGFWEDVKTMSRWDAERYLPEGVTLPSYTRKRGRIVKVGETPEPYKASYSADAWGLYTVSMDCAPAAEALNAALTEAVAEALTKAESLSNSAWDDLDDYGRKTKSPVLKLAAEARDKVYETMSEFSEFGARDSEPEGALTTFIERALGLPGYSLDR